jgi:DNA-binding MarR family transcriptional regulator
LNSPTRSRLSCPADIDDLLLYRLHRLAGVPSQMVVRLCEGRFGITRREWRVLAVLAKEGGLQSSQLALHAQLDRARTSRAVTGLVSKGLVSRVTAPADRRQVRLTLTAGGESLYENMFPLVDAINRDMLSGLSETETVQLDATLTRLQVAADSLVAAAPLPKADRRRGGRKHPAAAASSSTR